jgi:FkbM family methyltransferase
MRNLIIRGLQKTIRVLSPAVKTLEVKEEPSSVQAIRVMPWFRDEGDKTHRLNYELNADSIVFDLGGYEGEWASQIYCLYGSAIYIFEPYEVYFKNIQKKFLHNKQVRVFQFGLSNNTQTTQLSLADNSSSIFLKSDNSVDIKLVDASDFLKQNNITQIDLMKINIEGGEYDLLEHLIETGNIMKVKNIQVQFHDFIPDAEKRMKAIQNDLQKTHELTYQYEFVWENWKLKNI